MTHIATFAATPTVQVVLPTTPLFSGGGSIRPNLLLDLSVEFPTVKAAYGNASDYNKSLEYLGYFNNKKCYSNGGTKAFSKDKGGATIPTRTVGTSNLTNGYFSVAKDADANHECGGGFFSGNFMNWASSSSIDMLRLALTGGDRIVDSASQTILQRAFLYSSFYNSGNFRKKIVAKSATMSEPNLVTPFNVTNLYILNCDNKILFSENKDAAGGCGTQRTYPDNKWLTDDKLDINTDRVLGEYLARVQVCDASESTTRTDLCFQYPNGTYKPIGNMQRKQNSIRLGAFGYLMDNTVARYGGVLRAPLKYIGSKQYRAASGFAEEANDRPEWNATSGIFFDNPEGDASGNSGVINYLNKFGRNGVYKTYDTVGELYYESIRYLQGRAPTPEAISGITTAMKDNFQVLTTWEDPIEASCQNNYIITIADANAHYDRYIPGNTRVKYSDTARPADTATAKWPAFNVMDQTQKIANMESSGAYGNSIPIPSLSNMSTADVGSGDHGTYYMAGAAYWAHTNDIRLDKPTRVKTFSIDVDENGDGTIDGGGTRAQKPRLSQLYLTGKYGGFNDVNSDGNPFKTAGGLINNKEWALGNDKDPDTYFLASDPKRMINAIGTIFDSTAKSGGTLAGVGISSTSASDFPYVYEPGFKPSIWSGKLLKKSATSSATPLWDAGIIMAGDLSKNIAPNPLPAARKIYTAKVEPDGSLTTVDFIWSGGGNFSPENQTALNSNPITGVVDGLASDRIDYLRGIHTKEIIKDAAGNDVGLFRSRKDKDDSTFGVLGDIVNSAPVYYGAPAKNISGAGYSTFYSSYATRQKAVYVGANDGMLHAFNADSGEELFAYVPNALIPKLSQLSDPSYDHSSFVDGKITIKETQIRGAWKTLLVSGMGAGNKGIFALDVTNPANFNAGLGAIWEFTDANDADMGYVMAPPLIAKFRTGSSAGVATYGNFVVISSGYNNYGLTASSPGVLFLLSLDKKAGDPWVENVNYFKRVTPVSKTDTSVKNGLGAPAVAYGGDGGVNYAYAGDLQGNLWRFEFPASKPLSEKITPVSIFKALTSGVAQPITVKPQIIFAPGGGYIISFGTGKYLESDDVAPIGFNTSSYYSILDDTFSIVTGRTQLEPRTVTPSGVGFTITGNNFTYGTTTGTKKGWYFDFYNSKITGEKNVTDGTISGPTLFFNSLLLNSNPCANGSGRMYQVDALTGRSDGITGDESDIGLLSSPIIINISTSVGDRSATGARKTKTNASVRISGTGNSLGKTSTDATAPETINRTGRISWRELQNWQELRKDANK